MKKIIIILIVSFAVSTSKANAQAIPVTDTLAYLQTIVNNKANYIGQPFSLLVNNLQIQIKYFQQNTDIYSDISKETSSSFSFYFPQNINEFYLTYPRLRILWATPLNATLSWNLFRNYRGAWNSVTAAFYSNSIIADIQIRK